MVHLLLVVLAIILFVAGLFKLSERQYVPAAVLIIGAFLVGPGGVSIFT